MFSIEKISRIHVFFLLNIIFFLQANSQEEDCQWQKQPIMTIFVHGIIKPPWTFRDLIHIAQNNIETTRYKFASEYLRKSHEYFLTQPMQNLGLRKIDLTSKYPTCAAAAIASVYEKIEGNSEDLYYTFGWSGFFNKCYREMEAKTFYDELLNELTSLKKINIFPKIRIVAFSHGGNVALNLAKHIPIINPPIEIDRLMLIGTPIQFETDHLILHPSFKKVYNFYSEGDIAQNADFLTTKYGTSSRTFKSRKDFILPDKFTQIQLRVTKIVKNCKGKTIRTIIKDPNHLELWTFGWVHRIYREKFPLNPLPMATLLPLIINTIDSIDKDLSKELLVNIIPKLETIIIKDKKTKIKNSVGFPSYKLDELKKCALQFKTDFAFYKHAKLVKDALTYAHKQRILLRQQNCKISLKFGSKKRK